MFSDWKHGPPARPALRLVLSNFEKINNLNLSLQGESFYILKVNNNIKAFKRKIQRWTGRVESGRKEWICLVS